MKRIFYCSSCGAPLYVSPFSSEAGCDACGNRISVPPDPPDTRVSSGVYRLLDIARYNLRKGRWDEVKENCEYVRQLDEDNPYSWYLTMLAHLQCRSLTEVKDYEGMFLNTYEFMSFAEWGPPPMVARIREVGERNYRKERFRLDRFRYNAARTLYSNACSSRDYRRAAEAFGKVLDFRDGAFMRRQCLAKAESLERKRA